MSFLEKVPIPTAGVALGAVALGNLLSVWSFPAKLACGTVSLMFILLLIAKVVFHPKLIRDDLNNSIMASVSGTLFMTIMQLATYLSPYLYTVALAIWCCAVAGHVALIIWFSAKFIRRFKLPEVFPTYFICYVGIIVASVTSPNFHQEEMGLVLFWFGFICYIVLFGIITYRYAKHEVPESARPLFCIYAAPMSLSLVGYLSVADHPAVGLVVVLIVLAQALFFFVLFHLPKFVRLDFYPSFAAMTFPFVISATALLKAVEFLGSEMMLPEAATFALNIAIVAETVFASCIVIFVIGHYARFFIREFTSPNAPDVIEDKKEDAHFADYFEN